MSAKDIFHESVKRGLVKDGWTIIADPLELEWEGVTVKGDHTVDRIELYRNSIQALLQKHNQHSPKNNSDVESELLFDIERDSPTETLCERYQLMRVGWQEMKRIYHTTMHFDIKDGKIWIQQNMTDVDVGQELVDLGVPKEDIILGLQPPYKRPYTGYGVA